MTRRVYADEMRMHIPDPLRDSTVQADARGGKGSR